MLRQSFMKRKMQFRTLLKKFYRFIFPVPDHWTHFLSILDGMTLEHNPDLNENAKQDLFKRNITLVELEPHAYCNRTCSFCPNSTIDRLTVQTELDRPLYEKILDDLQTISYDKVLRFARYSEPMADDHIYEMVSLARQYLPEANIDIVTNGDYLNAEALNRLREVGLSTLRISIYMRKNIPWSVKNAQEEILRLAQRIEVNPKWASCTESTVAAKFPYSGMETLVYSHNFDKIGYDRGHLVSDLIDKTYVRQSPCFLVFSNFTVDYNGKVMPCCNLRSDHVDHEQFILGDLQNTDQNIFDIYANRLSTAWRRSLVKVEDKQSPCDSCKQKILNGAALGEMRDAVNSRLDSLGVRLGL